MGDQAGHPERVGVLDREGVDAILGELLGHEAVGSGDRRSSKSARAAEPSLSGLRCHQSQHSVSTRVVD